MRRSVIAHEQPHALVVPVEVIEEGCRGLARICIVGRRVAVLRQLPRHCRGAEQGDPQAVVALQRVGELHARTGPIGGEAAELGDRDANTRLRDLAGERLAQPFERPLAGVVEPEQRHRTHPAGARDLHDAPASLPAQVRQDGLTDPERAEQVRVEVPAGLAFRHLLHPADEAVAGVVDDDVQTSEARDPPLDRREDGRAVADVEREHPQGIRVFPGEVLENSRPARGRDDLVPGSEGSFGERATQAAAGASDEPDAGHSSGSPHKTRRYVSSAYHRFRPLTRRDGSSR